MKKIFLIFLPVLMLLFSCKSKAQFTYSTRIVKDSLFIPWEIVWGPDDHIWFTQKNGFICRVEPATGFTDTLYNAPDCEVNNEGGMLGMAIDPNFSTQPYVYVSYEYYAGSTYYEKVVRLTYTTATNTLGSPMILVDSISGGSIHNGCRLLIVGDKLFITTGETGVTSKSQNLTKINGKILRINLDGSIPADNPIAGSSLWTWGHRNPQGLWYANGILYSSEHGPNNDDEINIIEKGRNYGWPNVEGLCNTASEITFCTDSNVKEPVHIWTPTIATCGIEYYNQALFPYLDSCLLLCSLKDSHLYRLKMNNTVDSVDSVSVITGFSFGRLRDVCVSPDGKIYVSTSNSSASGSGIFQDRIIEIYDPAAAVHDPKTLSVSCFPNPAKDLLSFTVKGFSSQPIQYLVSDMEGRKVATGLITGSGAPAISVAALAPGSYLLQVWQKQNEFAAQVFQVVRR